MTRIRKLTESEYFELQAQFDVTPGPGDIVSATGEHYRLVHILNKIGYRESNKWQALKLAERLLANGYSHTPRHS